MTGERGRVARLTALLLEHSKQVEVGVGDDAAVLAPLLARTVLSVDAQVENVHFKRGWLTLRELGARAVMSAMSDLAAMGAEGRATLLSIATPPWVDEDAFDALMLGARDAAEQCLAPIVGGNLTRASELSLHTTVVGKATQVVQRDGARVGHAVFVTGSIGAAALGLHALQHGLASEAFAPFVHRWRAPQARMSECRRLAEFASASIDLSDGLIADATQLAEASGVGLQIDAAALPMAEGFVEACKLAQRDPFELACTGGEDYEVLFTAPMSETPSRFATCIGVVVSGREVSVRHEGRVLSFGRAGFDHFAP
jgi:thiamine-monophosphate kinase